MHGERVQLVRAAVHSQEPRRLLKRLLAQSLHLQQILAACERAIGGAMRDDGGSHLGPHPGHVSEQVRRGGVYVHTHLVHHALHHAVQAARQRLLVDVVLVHAHPDGLGGNLDKLGERVLEATRDGHRAAQSHVQRGQLANRRLAGAVHAGARLADHRVPDIAGGPSLPNLLQDLRHELLRVARGGAVPDGHHRHRALHEHVRQLAPGLLGHVRAARKAVQGARLQHRARGVAHRHLAPAGKPRVQPQHHSALERRLHEQRPQVDAELLH
mmetsp:Transcript_4351/g.8211  ORF Transcript_4351/g.8211 Transcript_4351/m.8211 type:complete len:270 (-) Transcript_4351:1361-2170(-)